MVILQINKFFYEKGGSERYFFMLSRALQERGHDVVHFSMHHPENLDSPFKKHFVSYRDYGTSMTAPSNVRQAVSFVRSREAARNLSALIAEDRPQVAHLHNVYHQITPSIIPVLRDRRIPVVITLHDYKLVCPNYTLFAHGKYCDRCVGGHYFNAATTRCNEGSFLRSALLSLEAYWQRLSRVYDSIDLFLAPSRFMRDMFVRAGFAPDRVMYLPSFLPETLEGGDSGLESLPPRYLLYFGRLSEEKGLMTLMTALSDQPDVPLVLCGDGPMKAQLQTRAAELKLTGVHFTGHVDKQTLDAIIRRASAVVLPSEWPENAPFTVLEAVASGVPVIVSDMGGLPEMAEIVSGWVVPHANAPALSRAIDAAWRDEAGTRSRGEEGMRAARAYFDRDKHMNAIEDVYRSALAKKARVS